MAGKCIQQMLLEIQEEIGGVDGKEAQEGRDICISIVDSHCCTAGPNNIVRELYSN